LISAGEFFITCLFNKSCLALTLDINRKPLKRHQMKKIVTVILFLNLSFAVTAQTNEEEIIKENFNNYRTYLLQSKGKEAVKFLDSRSINYYETILEHLKNADSLKVESLPLMDKFMVFGIRKMVPKEDILKFDGKALLVYAIDNGMIDNSSARNTGIGEVTVEDHFAKGQLIVNGNATPHFLHFYNEEGQWKYDLTSLFPIGTPYLEKMVETLGEKGIAKIIQNLDTLNYQNQDIWEPVN
jgi:hypothetical protein